MINEWGSCSDTSGTARQRDDGGSHLQWRCMVVRWWNGDRLQRVRSLRASTHPGVICRGRRHSGLEYPDESLTGHHAGRYYCTSGCLSTGFCPLNNQSSMRLTASGLSISPSWSPLDSSKHQNQSSSLRWSDSDLTACAFIHRFIHPFNYLIYSSFHPSISSHLFIHPTIYPFIYSSIYPFIHKSIFSFIHSSIYLFIFSFIHPSIQPSIHPFFHPSIHPWFLFVICVCVCILSCACRW